MNTDVEALDLRRKELSLHHAAWLEQPMTKTSMKVLEAHEKTVTEMIASSSMNKDLSDAYVRQLTVQLQTIKAIRKLLYDTETFVTRHGN